MRWSDISFKLSNRSLRQFAVLWLAFLGGLACWQWLGHGRPVAGAILGALALSVGIAGLIWPRAAWPFYVGLTVLTFPIGWVMTRAILGILFLGLFTPIGLLFKLLGRDVLQVKRRAEKTTYWAPKRTPSDPRSYLRLS